MLPRHARGSNRHGGRSPRRLLARDAVAAGCTVGADRETPWRARSTRSDDRATAVRPSSVGRASTRRQLTGKSTGCASSVPQARVPKVGARSSCGVGWVDVRARPRGRARWIDGGRRALEPTHRRHGGGLADVLCAGATGENPAGPGAGSWGGNGWGCTGVDTPVTTVL
jgi:hypothetical protein